MKRIALICIFGCLISSCIKDNIIIPDTGSKITINGLITTNDLLNVRISRSIFITDVEGVLEQDSLISIDNAQVKIYQNNSFIDSLYYYALGTLSSFEGYLYQNGNYISKNLYPETGKEYKITAKAPGSQEASSITKIPNLVRIENVDTSRIILENVPKVYPTNLGLKCIIEFTDPVNETNYYLLNAYRNNPIFSDAMAFRCDDPIVEEKLISAQGGALSSNPIRGIAFSDKLINGKKTNITITICGNDIGLPFWTDDPEYNEDGNHKKTIFFRLYSITEDYFKYIQTLNLYQKSYDNPLSDPVLVYSNIKGGYGIFAGAAVSRDSIVFHY
jgi:hypothetical protein